MSRIAKFALTLLITTGVLTGAAGAASADPLPLPAGLLPISGPGLCC